MKRILAVTTPHSLYVWHAKMWVERACGTVQGAVATCRWRRAHRTRLTGRYRSLYCIDAPLAIRLIIFLLLAFILLPSHSAQTPSENQDPLPTPTPADNAARWQWSFTIRNRTGFKLNQPHVLQMSRTLAEAKGIYKISDDWRLTLEGRAHYDPVERLGYPRSVWFDPRQVLLDGRIKKVDVKLGLQQVVWGQADGLRVLDVINPLDYREFILEDFIDSRRPLWLARADVPVGQGSLQMLWIPYFAPSRLPGPDAEFGLGPSFGLGLINAATGAANVPLPPFRIESTERPAYQFQASQFGARYSRSLGAWDVTANYFYGWEDVPTSYLRGIELAPTPTLVIKPRYDRKEVFGGTAATNFDQVVLRLEAGWNRGKAAAVTTVPITTGFAKFDQFSGVVGVDYSARTWLWISGQYFLQFVAAPQAQLLFPRYNHLASIYFRTNFRRETLRPEFFVLTGLNQQQYLLRPRVTKTLGDNWSVSLGADFFGGRATNIFGYFDARDRVVLELKWLK